MSLAQNRTVLPTASSTENGGGRAGRQPSAWSPDELFESLGQVGFLLEEPSEGVSAFGYGLRFQYDTCKRHRQTHLCATSLGSG